MGGGLQPRECKMIISPKQLLETVKVHDVVELVYPSSQDGTPTKRFGRAESIKPQHELIVVEVGRISIIQN